MGPLKEWVLWKQVVETQSNYLETTWLILIILKYNEFG